VKDPCPSVHWTRANVSGTLGAAQTTVHDSLSLRGAKINGPIAYESRNMESIMPMMVSLVTPNLEAISGSAGAIVDDASGLTKL
jgi:hypothetical protein